MRARKPAPLLDEPALLDYAVRLLGRQMRTVAELKSLLRRRVQPGEPGDALVNAVLVRLQERRYLNDADYAQDFTRLRQENAAFGRRRVQQDLIRKGVAADLIAATLDSAYQGVSEEDLARRHLERKRVRKPSGEKEAARVARMLLRAGFSPSAIVRVLKNWNVDDDTLRAVETMEPDDRSPGE